MIAFFEVVLRLQNAQIFSLNWWKSAGSPDAVVRAVKRWSFISNF